jgi:hypothetical protein
LTSDPKKILVCALSTYERNGWHCKELSEWLEGLRFERKYLTSVSYAHNFSPAAAARNYLCREVKGMDKANRPDWILMVDNDMAPPSNLLSCIDNAPSDAGVIVPRFYMWDQNKQSVILCWGMDPKDAPERNGAQIFTVQPGEFYPLTKAGTGAMFIRPSLLDEIEPPYFSYTYNQDGAMTGTEDIRFCVDKVGKTKWKIYGNSDIEVGHFHNVNLALLARWLYAQEAKKQTVEELSPAAECFR